MKKLLILILLTCICAFQSFSQRHDFLTLSLGGSFPVGEYGNKNTHDSKSGVAGPGGIVDISYGHPLRNSSFGLMATLRGRFNPLDNKAEIAPLAAQYPDYAWSAKNASWKSLALMVGAFYNKPLDKRLAFQLAILAGAGENQLPGSTITGFKSDPDIANEAQIVLSNKRVYAVAFSAMAKAGVTYQLKKHLFLAGNVAFWNIRPSFKNVTVLEDHSYGFVIPGIISLYNARSWTRTPHVADYSQPMNSIDVSIGAGITL